MAPLKTPHKIHALGAGKYLLVGKFVFDTLTLLLQQLKYLKKTSDNSDTIILNCAGITKIDSAGVALLLDWKHHCEANKQSFRLKKLPPQTKAILHASRLDFFWQKPKVSYKFK